MFIDVKFCKFMPSFLVSNKSVQKRQERKKGRKKKCVEGFSKWPTWKEKRKSNANSILIKKIYENRQNTICILVRHSLFQILIQLSDGLKIFPLGFSNGNLTLPCCLWVDINKGLGSHNSLGFCKESNLTVQIIISIPVEFHCRTTARLEFINIPYDIPLRDWKPFLTITLCMLFFGGTNCMHYFIQRNDCPDSDN